MTDEYVRVDDVKELITIALEQNENEAIKRIKYRSLTPSKIVHNLELDIREFHRKEKGDINDE